MMPAGPPPMMQQVVADELAEGGGICGDERSKQVVARQRPQWRPSIQDIGRARFNASFFCSGEQQCECAGRL